MNKWQIICPVVAILILGIVLASRHAGGHRRTLVSAITQQIDGHSPQIAALLTSMRGSNVTLIEEAAYQELQTLPSTSLISRAMVTVAVTGDGKLQCVIDTSSLGIPPRTIRSRAD